MDVLIKSKNYPNKVKKDMVTSARNYILEWKNGFKLILKRDDLVMQETGAIVNAANDDLWLGGGVAGAIRKKGGDNIQNECRSIIKKLGRSMNNGDVVETGVGDFDNKNLKYIFHAVGPIYRGGKKKEPEELYKSFINCYKLAETKNIESISLPPISSGIYGYPKDECAEIFYKTIMDFQREKISSKIDPILKEVRMTIIDFETYSVFAQFHNSVLDEFKNLFGKELINVDPDYSHFYTNNEVSKIEKDLDENLEISNTQDTVTNCNLYEDINDNNFYSAQTINEIKKVATPKSTRTVAGCQTSITQFFKKVDKNDKTDKETDEKTKHK